MSRLFRIAIDGPAASGKSTTAKLLAQRLGFSYIDSGAMFRAITLQCLESGINPNDPKNTETVGKISQSCRIHFPAMGQIELNGRNVSEKIRDPAIVRSIAPVASNPVVRATLALQQQALAKAGTDTKHLDVRGVVMDGRDIGTVILPDAELKIFLVASVRIRAERRFKELQERQAKNVGTVDDVARDIEARDHADRTRTQSPLRKASDAVELNTSNHTIDEQVALIEKMVRSRLPCSESN